MLRPLAIVLLGAAVATARVPNPRSPAMRALRTDPNCISANYPSSIYQAERAYLLANDAALSDCLYQGDPNFNCTLTASIEPYRTACTNYSYIFYTIDVAYQCLVADGSLHLNLCFPEMCTREDIASMIENNFPGPNSTCTRTETFNPIPTPSPLPSPTASPTPSPGADAPDASATASISLLAAAVVALLTVARQDN